MDGKGLWFLATQYRIVGLADHGKTYLQKSVAISDKFTDESSYDSYMGIIFQEKAYYAIGEKNMVNQLNY